MAAILRPRDERDLCEAIAASVRSGRAIEVRGGGSKAAIGHPDRDVDVLETGAFAGVIDYDPAELVLTAGAATPLREIAALLRANGQMLAFEPFDHAALLGGAPGRATIGGVIAAGVAGSRRLTAGGARDHLLGFRAVSGRGEAFVGGAKVVKNVTGYDLPKLMAGSWGRLAVLTAVTVKVLPAPRDGRNLALRGLSDRAAVRAMAAALGSPADVSAAAHLPEEGVTILRLEGVAPSIAARAAMLHELLGADGSVPWPDIAAVGALADGAVLWRVSVPPSHGPDVWDAVAGAPEQTNGQIGARRLYDWAGGLVWLALPADADHQAVRRAAAAAGGHAMLVRAPLDLRRRLPALHPPAPGVARLEQRVKAAFDPAGVLDPARFGHHDAH